MFFSVYTPVPDTNPQQYLASFTLLADQLLPPIQEPALAELPSVLFCATIDSNGYMPTHNRKFSCDPRPGDTDWNNINALSRRFFKDEAGIRAASSVYLSSDDLSSGSYNIYAYDFDIGGGRSVLLNEVAAPILLFGRHWGAVRLGYTM